jgi:hypothetical protein
VYGEDIDWVGEEFDFHACGDYSPLRVAAEDLDKTGWFPRLNSEDAKKGPSPNVVLRFDFADIRLCRLERLQVQQLDRIAHRYLALLDGLGLDTPNEIKRQARR